MKLASEPFSSSYSHYSPILPPTKPAAYALIVGAGFSVPVVPLVKELMEQKIGDYFYPDQDQWSADRGERVLRRHSADFWSEFNGAAARENIPIVELDRKGLPKNSGAAYQYLFTGEGASALFALKPSKTPDFVERLEQARREIRAPNELREEKARLGKSFVNGFLRYVLDPGSESGHGSTGRSGLNLAHIYLAALLEAQQTGRGWRTVAFCRTILTTNFDTLLQNALQRVNLLYRLTDRPEKGLDLSDFIVEEGPIHLVYAHGSILRHNPASTIGELGGLESCNVEVLRHYLDSRDVITIGYSGWNDGLMAALRRRDSSQRKLYWCDVRSQPAPHVASFLSERSGSAVYVQLSKDGADGLMRALYEALIPREARTEAMRRYERLDE